MNALMKSAVSSIKGVRTSTKVLLFLIAVVSIVGIGVATPTNASATENTAVSASYGLSSVSAPTSVADSIVRTADWPPDRLQRNLGVPPKTFMDQAATDGNLFGAACSYLTFCRWWNANQVPTQNFSLTSLSQLGGTIASSIAQIVYSIGSMIVFLVGMLLIMVSSVDLTSIAIFSADYLFATFMTSFLGMRSGSLGSAFGAIGIILMIVVIGVGVSIALPSFNRRGNMMNTGRFQTGLRSLAISLIALIAFGFVAYQSLSNHTSTADGRQTSAVAALGDPQLTTPGQASAAGVNVSDPASWTPASAGWIVAMGKSGANWVQTWAVTIITNLFDQSSNVITSGNSAAVSTCDQYIDGMHDIFTSSPAARGATMLNGDTAAPTSILIAYDDLVDSVYFQNYATSIVGGTTAGKNAWCRTIERQTNRPAGDQIFISQTAGLYSGITNQLVDSDGNWKTMDSGYNDTNEDLLPFNWFVRSGRESTDTAVQMMWGGCVWAEGAESATLNSAWAGIQRADGDGTFDDSMCNITPDTAPDLDNKWGYQVDKGLLDTGIGSLGFFPSLAKLNASPAAMDYFLTSNGFLSQITLVASIIAAVLLYLMGKFIVPVSIGAALAQVVGTVILILSPIILLAFIIPSVALRQRAINVLKMFVASIFVVSLIAVIMALAFGLASIFQALFLVAYFPTGGIGGIMISIVTGIATFLAFFVLKTAFHGLFGFDITNMKNALQLGAVGAMPLLDGMGLNFKSPFNPLSMDDWRGLRDKVRDKPEKKDLLNDENSTTDAAKSSSDPDLIKNDENSKDAKDAAKTGLKGLTDTLASGKAEDGTKGIPGTDLDILNGKKGSPNDLGELKTVKDEAARRLNKDGKDSIQDFRKNLTSPQKQGELERSKNPGLESFINSVSGGTTPTPGKLGPNGLSIPNAKNAAELGAAVSGMSPAAALAPLAPAASRSLVDALDASSFNSNPLGAGTMGQADGLANIASQSGGSLPVPDFSSVGAGSPMDVSAQLQNMGAALDGQMAMPQSGQQIPYVGSMMPAFDGLSSEDVVRARMAMLSSAFASVGTDSPSQMVPEQMAEWSNLIGSVAASAPENLGDFNSWNIDQQSRAQMIIEAASRQLGIRYDQIQVGQAAAAEIARDAAIRAAARNQNFGI